MKLKFIAIKVKSSHNNVLRALATSMKHTIQSFQVQLAINLEGSNRGVQANMLQM